MLGLIDACNRKFKIYQIVYWIGLFSFVAVHSTVYCILPLEANISFLKHSFSVSAVKLSVADKNVLVENKDV